MRFCMAFLAIVFGMACAKASVDDKSAGRIRIWSETNDDGSVQCLGNGLFCVYEAGPNIIQAFGPPYSTASVMKLGVKSSQGVLSKSTREVGTAIWTHKLSMQGAPTGSFLDFVDSDLPSFVRGIQLTSPISLTFEIDHEVDVVPERSGQSGEEAISSLLITSPSGRYLYPKYPMPYPVSYQLIVSGAASINPTSDNKHWEIRLESGESRLILVGGPHFPETQQNAEKASKASMDDMLKRTRAYWGAFTVRRRDFASLIPENVPERPAMLQAIDDVSVIIKTQEARGGGILAGYPFHLLYVRDQYGVSRCLLRLGYTTEAKGILERDWGIWKRHGCIHNAQAADVDGVFHIHENDDVEITGYLILQAFDYAKTSNDWAFVKEILPMLDWAWTVQQKHLVHDMLPFNGDETYVAGGILPRSTLNDGSAEATLLFITGGERLLGFVEKEGLWSAERIEKEKVVLGQVRDSYNANFIVDGRYITNNPARKDGLELPRFRHGVCESCSAFGWTERNVNERYVCPRCSCKEPLPAVPPTAYSLPSAALLPCYIGADLPGKEQIAKITDGIVKQFLTNGELPSRPGSRNAVGYDLGLLLYDLSDAGNAAAENVYNRMMSIVDPTGAWVEYYSEYKPNGTRYRPWESGINLDAAISYISKKYGLNL